VAIAAFDDETVRERALGGRLQCVPTAVLMDRSPDSPAAAGTAGSWARGPSPL